MYKFRIWDNVLKHYTYNWITVDELLRTKLWFWDSHIDKYELYSDYKDIRWKLIWEWDIVQNWEWIRWVVKYWVHSFKVIWTQSPETIWLYIDNGIVDYSIIDEIMDWEIIWNVNFINN